MQFFGLIPLVFKLIVGFGLILLLFSIVILTGAEAVKKKLNELIVATFKLVGKSVSDRSATSIEKITSLLGSLSIPIIALTTLLTIPPHGIGVLQTYHDFIDSNFWVLLIVTEAITVWIIYNSRALNEIIVTILKIAVKCLIALVLGGLAYAAFSADVVTAGPGQSTADLARSFSDRGMNVAVLPDGGNIDAYRAQLRLLGVIATLFSVMFLGWASSNMFELEYELSENALRASKPTRRGILSGCAFGGAVCAFAIFVAYNTMPQFREAVEPGAVIAFSAEREYGWPAPLLFDALMLGIPSFMGGIMVARLSFGPLSFLGGLFGIMIGCWWELHLAGLGADIANAHGGTLLSLRVEGGGIIGVIENIEYDLLIKGGTSIGIVTLILPVLCGYLILRVFRMAESILKSLLYT